MRDLARLMDAVYEAYNLALPYATAAGRLNRFEPFLDKTTGRWNTRCNEAFNFVARRMDYHKFDLPGTPEPNDALLANIIFLRMQEPGGDWRQIDAGLAAQMATSGFLVAAIDHNVSAPGHICVVVPGILEYSGSYGYAVPKVMNVGKDVFIGKKASYAFQASDKPLYFCLKSDFEPPANTLRAVA